MTPKEHILLIHLLTQQNIFLKQLCDALKSKGVLTDDDIQLFGDYLHSDEVFLQVMLQRTLRRYLDTARKLGVETGAEALLTDSPKPQGGMA